MPSPPASGQHEWQRPCSEGVAEFSCRVRLALLQGLSQLPGRASRADCLPPPEEGSLLSGLISCQLSVFFLCFCCSLRQTDGVGKSEKLDFQSGALSRQATLTQGPAPLGSVPLRRPSLLLRSGLALSPNLLTIVCPGTSAAISYLLGWPPLMETLHVHPPVLKDQAKRLTPGYDIRAPQKAGLCCYPLFFHGSTL